MKESARRLLPWVLIGAGALLLSVTLGCPLRRWLGVGCPFCGMSRAWLRALRLDLAEAFRFHPLWPLLPLPPLLTWLEQKRPGSSVSLIWALGALFLAVYILRMYLRDPTVWPVWAGTP